MHFTAFYQVCFCLFDELAILLVPWNYVTCAEVAPNHGEATGRERNVERDGSNKVQHRQGYIIGNR